MKFNFKKISAIATSALMLGMTMGVAAAASFPSPYSSSTSAGVAVVTGTGTGVDDTVAANSIANYLAAVVTSTDGVTLTGEKVQIDRDTEHFNLGDNANAVFITSVDKSDLPTLLADGTYMNDENDEYDYKQKVTLSTDFILSHFADTDYEDEEPTVGFHLADGIHVLNYTIDFTKQPASDVGSSTTGCSDGDLCDFETTELTILGKTYYILDADNATLDFTLLDSATTAIITVGETSSLVVGDKTYEVAIEWIDTTNVKLSVDGIVTNKLAEGGTYKLGDGAYVGVKTNMYAGAFAGAVHKVEIGLGKGKLFLDESNYVELNDKDVKGITSYITRGTPASSKEKVDKIVLKWDVYDEAFMAAGQELLMPGFEALKFSMTGMTYPAEETIQVKKGGNDYIQLTVPFEDGSKSIDLLYANATAGWYQAIGKAAADHKLVTSNSDWLQFNYTSNVDSYFVVSWISAANKSAESYLLSADVENDDDLGNITTITNEITGEVMCENLDATNSPTCEVGNEILTISEVHWVSGGDKWVNITKDTRGSFDELYTVEGLKIQLPYLGTNSTINLTAEDTCDPSTTVGELKPCYCNDTLVTIYPTTFVLEMYEEDKEETLAQVNFNVTLGVTGTTPSYKVTVSDINTGSSEYEIGDTDVDESYVASELATKILYDYSGTQDFATITYHGGEVSANVFLAAPGAVTTTEAGTMVFTDAETTSWQSRDVILVGGSCINSATATALGLAYPTCEAAFTTATGIGSGKYLIQSIAGSTGGVVNSGKIALVVAGYSKADTAAAAQKLVNLPSSVDTTAGNKYVGTLGVEGTSIITGPL